jgi:MFS family permease
MRLVPTAPVAAASLIAGFAVAVGTGSRPLGGLVMAIGGLWCIQTWARRHGRRTAVILGCVGFGAFVVSHLLGLLIGAWPSVLLVSAVVGAAVWRRADAQMLAARISAESPPPRPKPV